MLRHLSENAAQAVNFIYYNGNKAAEILQNLENFRSEKNKLNDCFKIASKEEKQKLREEATNLKNKIQIIESEYSNLEKQLQEQETLIPNILASDVLLSNVNSEQMEWKRTILYF